MACKRREYPSTVAIDHAVIDAMLEHARHDLPDECCGLLLGTPELVSRAKPARNLEASPTRYRVDPADHFAAIRAARVDGQAVVGTYHSHPNCPPEPSRTDLEEASYPNYVYVIVSPGVRGCGDDRVEAYRLTGDRFARVELLVR